MFADTAPPGYVAAAQLDKSPAAHSNRSSPVTVLSPPASLPDTDSPEPSQSEKKKRKSWGQEIPDIPRTLGPRKRAKTDQERQQRNIERIERNRHSAAKSREKQKAEASELRKENQEQKEYILRLEERLRQYEGGSAPSSMPSIPTPTSDQFPHDFPIKVESEPSEFADDRSCYSFYGAPTPQPMSRSISNISSTMSSSTLAPALRISQTDRAPSAHGIRNSATPQVELQRSLGVPHNVSMTKVEGAPHSFDSNKMAPALFPSVPNVSSGSQHSAAVFSTNDQQCPLETSFRWAGRPIPKYSPASATANSLVNILICFQTLLIALTSQVSTKTISTIRKMFSQAERQLVGFSPTSRDQILILMLSLITTPTAKTTATPSSAQQSVFRGRLLRKLVAWSPISAHLLKVAAGRASQRMVSEGRLLDEDPAQVQEWASLMTVSWALHRSLAAMGHSNLSRNDSSSSPYLVDQQDDDENDETMYSEGFRREWIRLQQQAFSSSPHLATDSGMYQNAWSTESGNMSAADLSTLHNKFMTLKGTEL
ncbi:MAG: hypothetical protein Q9160_000021 [Pyrenula sp. 1 TL-2023]